MKLSLRTDVSTSSAHEGLFISTGVIAADAVATSAESNFHTFRHFLSPFDNAGGDSIEFVPRQLSLFPQNTFFDTEQRQQQHMTRSSGNNSMEQMNADQGDDGNAFCLNQRQNGEEGVDNDGISMAKRWPTKSKMEPLEPIKAQMQMSGCEATKIKLNLFGNDDEDSSINNDKCTELVPLVRSYSKAPTPSLSLSNRDAQKCQRMPCDPLLCDTTTTTTTLEVFRAKPDNFHFFQLPKGPLSTAKESVELVPVEGPDYQRIHRSETQFSDRTNSVRHDSGQQKGIQWGESLPIPPSPSDAPSVFGSTKDCPINVPFAGLSPPQRSSTPLRFITDPVSVQRPTDATQQIGRIIDASSSDGDVLLQSTEDMTTVLRRQRRDKSERFLRQRKMDSAKREQKEEAEVPPRPPKCRDKTPPKCRDKTMLFVDDSNAPPRPPKPTKYLRKSQSSDLINPKGNGLVRSSASDNILKLYQTKDCLGRVVCEW
uniref:Uncharacterized protein n=1 Tax=Globodera rostochiensis TaxID=31243 RepID=A0A914I8N5_GLORO